ncbi:MAG: CoA-binding protein [Bacteroidota bacterium]
MKKRTLVMGAAPDPSRYAYKATVMLEDHGHEVIPFGIKKGKIRELEIENERPTGQFDTVTLYLGPQNQPQFYDYIVGLKPQRVIFNPGTENAELEDLLEKNGIEPVHGCTLVMLSTGQY